MPNWQILWHFENSNLANYLAKLDFWFWFWFLKSQTTKVLLKKSRNGRKLKPFWIQIPNHQSSLRKINSEIQISIMSWLMNTLPTLDIWVRKVKGKLKTLDETKGCVNVFRFVALSNFSTFPMFRKKLQFSWISSWIDKIKGKIMLDF